MLSMLLRVPFRRLDWLPPRSISLQGIALLSLCFCLVAIHAAWATPPNIVLIISDDQAWTDYGFMGHPQIQTPNLDRLAKESLTFQRGYVPISLCRPSLATIVTGLYPHQHGIVGNDPRHPTGLAAWNVSAEDAAKHAPAYNRSREALICRIDTAPTLPRMLGKIGYLSYQSGKWWEGSFRRGGFTHGMTRGFPNPGGRHGDAGLAIGREGMAPVLNFIDMATERQKPFFVYYAPFLPHTPHTPPARLLKKYRPKTDSEFIAKYWAMCEWFDETVGELLDHLDARQLSKNTIVLYVSDNGWINQPDRTRYAPRSKRSPYEGGTRTPIMVRWPGKVIPKMDKTHLASSIDLVPTVLAAVGSKPTSAMQGINLLDPKAVGNRKAIYGEIFEHDVLQLDNPVVSLQYRWIINGPWKLIVPHLSRVPNGSAELFNLKDDPSELHNLEKQNKEIVSRLHRQLDAWWSVD